MIMCDQQTKKNIQIDSANNWVNFKGWLAIEIKQLKAKPIL